MKRSRLIFALGVLALTTSSCGAWLATTGVGTFFDPTLDYFYGVGPSISSSVTFAPGWGFDYGTPPPPPPQQPPQQQWPQQPSVQVTPTPSAPPQHSIPSLPSLPGGGAGPAVTPERPSGRH